MARFNWRETFKDTEDALDKDQIKSEMSNWLTGEANNFISAYSNAKRGMEKREGNASVLVEFMKDILTEIESSKLRPMLERNDFGKRGIQEFTTKKIRGEADKPHEANIAFLDQLEFKDLKQMKMVKKLRGGGTTSKSEIKDFPVGESGGEDYAKFLPVKPVDLGDSTQADITFTQTFPEDGDLTNYLPRFSIGKDHFRTVYPYEDEEIVEAKTKYLEELLGSVPDYTPNNSKTKLTKLLYPSKINLPSRLTKEMMSNTSISIWEKGEEEFELTGAKPDFSKLKLKEKKKITSGEWALMLAEKGMSVFPKKEIITEKGEEDTTLIAIKEDQIIKVDSVSVSEDNPIIIKLSPEEAGSIIDDNLVDILKQFHDDYFAEIQKDPFKVYSFEINSSIKVRHSVSKSFTEMVAAINDKNQTSKFTSVTANGKPLTNEQAEKMENEAWTERATGKVISNSEYLGLGEVEQLKYSPNYYLVDVQGAELNPAMQRITSGVRKIVTGYKIPKSFIQNEKDKDAFAFTTFAKNPMPSASTDKKQTVYQLAGDSPKAGSGNIDLPKRITEVQYQKMPEARRKFYTPSNLRIQQKIPTLGEGVSKDEYDRLSNRRKKKLVLAEIKPKRWASLPKSIQELYKPVEEEINLSEKKLRRRAKENLKTVNVRDRDIKFSVRLPDSAGESKSISYPVTPIEGGYGVGILIFFDNVFDAFNDARIELDVKLIDLGELDPISNRNRKNDPMKKAVNIFRKNYNNLLRKLR